MSDIAPQDSSRNAMPYADALRLAVHLHRENQIEAAERVYQALHDACPDEPNAMHFLGVLLHQRGRLEGLALIERSLAIDDQVASWHNNLGNVLLDRGRVDEASLAYSRCTELDPDNIEVLNNLGVLLGKLRRSGEAEATFKRALEKDQRFDKAHINLASLYYEQKRVHEGHEHIAIVLAQKPGDPFARKVLGLLYASLGRLDEAATVFREWLKHEPDSEQARHHLAACTRSSVPERATEAYVEEVFDAFAGSFDAKLATLDYRAPQLIGETVGRLLGVPEPRYRILDAGCGTGLCGSYLSPYARALVGVDLSGNMLQQARTRGCYSEIEKSDLVAYLERCDSSHDVIVSADTLCYFGRLESVMKAARRALCRDGYFVFTLESLEGQEDYNLNPNGRYSHTQDYVRRTLSDAAFAVISITSDRLRDESGRPVAGWIVTARAAGP